MKKRYIVQFFSILIVLFSIGAYIYTSTIHTSYDTVNLHLLDIGDSYNQSFEDLEVRYIYTNQDNIVTASFQDLDDPMFYYPILDSDEELIFTDSNEESLFSMYFQNLTVPDNKVFYYDMTWAQTASFSDYRLLGKLTFQEGYYQVYLDSFSWDDNTPFALTDEIMTITETNYEEYSYIPLSTGGLGIFVILISVLTKTRGYDNNKNEYNQGRHKSKSRKREKY